MPSRRRLLRSVALGSAALCAGCLSGPRRSESSTPPPTDVIPTERRPTAHTTERRTRRPPDEYEDRFYVENNHDEVHCLSVSVTPDPVTSKSDEPVVEGVYRVDARSGLDFGVVGSRGAQFEVSARLDTGSTLDETWLLSPCPLRNDRPDGRSAAVRIDEEGELRFVTNNCDLLVVGSGFAAVDSPTESDCELD